MLRGCVPQSRRVPSQCAEAATRPSRRKRRQAVPAERRVSCRGGVSASAVVHDGGVRASVVVHDGGVSASAVVHDGGVSASAVVHDGGVSASVVVHDGGVVVPVLLLSPLLTIFSV